MANVLANYVKFQRGTPTAYANLAVKDKDTLYFVSNADEKVGQLYLGTVLIANRLNEEGLVDYLSQLQDVDTTDAVQNSILGFDATAQKWVVMDVNALVNNPVMLGATAEQDGVQGLVPAAKAGEQNYFLRGDGSWAEVKQVEAQVFQVKLADEETHAAAIERIVADAVLAKGDIVIVKDLIADDKYEHTAYVYNGSDWAAMDGNYNARNVFFDKDFTFTTAVGTVTIPSSGNQTVDAEGKNLYEFFAGLFAKEAYPTIPTTNVTLNSSNIGNVEVGTNIAVAYSFATSANAYKYGPSNNGVTFSDYAATFNGQTLNTKSGTFNSVQVTDTTSLSITGSVEQSAGAIPLTNLGNEYPSAQIPAKSWTGLTKGTLKGYRAWFCGWKNGDQALADPTAITGAQIRALGNSANGSWKSQLNVSQMQQMFFAAPAGKGYKPSVKDHSTTAPQTVLGPITVSVEGANGYDAIDYDVWYVANAAPASGSATLDIAKA